MAISIVTAPQANESSANIIYVLTQDAPPAGTIRQMRWQLRDNVGNPITPWESAEGVNGGNIRIDFSKEMTNLVAAYVASMDSAVFINSTGVSSKPYQLFYQEVDFDTTTCVPTLQAEQSDILRNAYAFYLEAPDIITPQFTNFVASRRPALTYLARGQSDFLHVWSGSLGISYSIAEFLVGGGGGVVASGSIGSLTYQVIGAGGVNTTGVNWGADGSTIDKITITLGSDLYTFKFYDDCESLEFREVIFCEPIGGMASVLFDKMEQGGSRSFTTAAKVLIREDVNSVRARSGGRRVMVNDSGHTITLRKKIDYSRDWQEFYQGFVRSSLHFVRRHFSDGDIRQERYILESAGIFSYDDTNEAEFVVTLTPHKLHQQVNRIAND